MPKIADLFSQNPDAPRVCRVMELNRGVQTQYGEKVAVKLDSGGVAYDWWLDPARADALLGGVSEGDLVEVTSVRTPGKQYASYRVRPANPEQQASAPPPGRSEAQRSRDAIQYRISIAGYLQALIARGHDIEGAKQLALELVRWSCQKADEMVDEDLEEAGLAEM